MWNNLIDILPKAAGKYNFAETLKAIEVCQEYRNISKELMSEEAIKGTFPKSYKDQTLTIGALSSAHAQQVQMNKSRIHKSLTKKFGENSIKNIKIEITERLPGEDMKQN